MEVVSARLSQFNPIYGSSMLKHFHVDVLCKLTCACRLERKVVVGDEMQRYWNPTFTLVLTIRRKTFEPIHSYNITMATSTASVSRTVATRKKEDIPPTERSSTPQKVTL